MNEKINSVLIDPEMLWLTFEPDLGRNLWASLIAQW